MAGVCELVKVLTLLIALGAATWAGFAVIAGDDAFTGGSTYDAGAGVTRSLVVFAVAVVIHVAAARLLTRLEKD